MRVDPILVSGKPKPVILLHGAVATVRPAARELRDSLHGVLIETTLDDCPAVVRLARLLAKGTTTSVIVVVVEECVGNIHERLGRPYSDVFRVRLMHGSYEYISIGAHLEGTPVAAALHKAFPHGRLTP